MMRPDGSTMAEYAGGLEAEVARLREERDALVASLEEHYLTGIECDHATGRDRPTCSCSLVDLGWHPSVGDAVKAWADHIVERAAALVRERQNPRSTHEGGRDGRR